MQSPPMSKVNVIGKRNGTNGLYKLETSNRRLVLSYYWKKQCQKLKCGM
jgi:hypothetical protein